MKDKNSNILSPRTSNPLLYIIYNWHSNPIVVIWTVVFFSICFDGAVIAAQCTALFQDLLRSPEFRYY